ncbi:MAG: hypothetical protein AMJ62_01435 [Myxococcales bacterium SG8_38]|nr:MAG: hypothetical protein AMJ62_01435 [Myxococcales bacterium SG8_38]
MTASDCPPDRMTVTQALTQHDAAADLARLAKALGHPARVHIVRTLLAKDTCVAGELSDELPLAASTVSQHLKILKEAGIIKGEVDGPRRCYCVDRSALGYLADLVEALHPATERQSK